MPWKCLHLPVILLLALFIFPVSASAHKVNIFAFVEAGVVYAESYFPDGRPIVAGQVSVFDSQGELLLQGETDQDGLFQFPLPKEDVLRLVIDAGMGHKNSYQLKKTASNE